MQVKFMAKIAKNTEFLIDKARDLRNNMTPQERHLWYDFLKKLPVTVHRQKCIGNFIVDFYIPSAELVIELDGSQHRTSDGMENDEKRDALLESYGIAVLRYRNDDINKRFGSVCTDIINHIENANHTPKPEKKVDHDRHS